MTEEARAALEEARAKVQQITRDLLREHHDDETGSEWLVVINRLYDAVDNGASQAARERPPQDKEAA